MAQPRRQPRRGGAALRHLAVPLALLLLPLCLAHLRAAAAAAAASPGWEQGAAAAPEKDAGQEARWRLTEEAPAVTERVGMEIIEDYPYVGPNNRHNPHP